MFCNQCGKQIPDDARFCHHCGSAVGIEPVEEPEAPVMEITEEPVEEIKTTKSTKEKSAVPGGRKKLILIVTAAVAVIAVAIVGISMVKNHQPVLAELPDPEYYFAEVGIDEIKDDKKGDGVKTVILRSNENIWNYAAGYVNLLKWSGRYPVSQSDEERYSSGDYMWNFVYNDKEDIKSPYFCQIEVNYYCKSNGRDVYAVWITMHDTDAFDLVQKEQYTESDAMADFSGVDGTDDSGTMNHAPENSSTSETPITDSSSDSVFENGIVDDDDDDDDFEVYEAEDIYDNPTPCGVCDGDGDCQTCSGDGYLMSSASDEEDRNCYSCSGSGNCRSCGGDGEL